MRRKKKRIPKKRSWYASTEPPYEGSDFPYVVFRTPSNFDFLRTPFDLHEAQPGEIFREYSAVEERYHTKSVALGKAIPARDIAKVSVRAMMGTHQGNEDDHHSLKLSWDDAYASGEDGMAVSLNGNAAASGERSVAITQGEHQSAVVSGDYSAAIAPHHGSNAAASGALSNAVSLFDGWAISGGGYAAAFGHGNAVACGDSGHSASFGGDAYALGKYGRAVAYDDLNTASASGKFGEAVSLGEYGKAACQGENGLAIATGRSGLAKGPLGCWLVLAQRDRWERPVEVLAVRVDGVNILPDTWYTVINGKISAVPNEEAEKHGRHGV